MLFKKKREVVRNPILPFLKKIKNLRKEEIKKESITKLNEVFRDYLKVKFRLPLSLTSEELVKNLELRKVNKTVKVDLIHLISEINHFEYNREEIPTKEEFDFLTRLAFKTIEEIAIGKRILEEEISKKKIEKPKERKESLNELTKKLDYLGKNFKIDWKNKETREIYAKIRLDYDKLNDSEKKNIYPRIISLFKLNGR